MMLLFMSALLPFLSCICLALGQKKYAKEIFGRSAQLPKSVICKRWAWGFLWLSLLCSLLSERVDFVIVLWPMLFGIDALVVALLITFRPEWLRVMDSLPGLRASK